MENLHYELFVTFCKVLANRLHTIVEVKKYKEFGWASVDFMTDKFGGCYLLLHYDLKSGKIVADYGNKDEQEITSTNQLIELTRKRMEEMLSKRDLDYIYECVNSEY